MSVQKPKVVLTRYKSPTVTTEDGAAPVERARKTRRPLEVPRWLALAPALFFGALGLVLIGVGVVLKLGLMAFYNVTAGDIVQNHPDRRLWDQLVLNRENFLSVLFAFVNGIAALGVCSSWLWSESRRALKLTFAMIGFFFVSAGLLQFGKPERPSRPVVNAAPAGAGRQGLPAQAPAFPPQPAAGNQRAPVVDSSNAPVVTIFLYHMTDAERSSHEQVLKREFQSLNNYVPDTVRIEGNTLVWRATILVQHMEQHKMEAIAILRRNNIRLSDFSEWWLKGRASGQIPGPPMVVPR